MRIKVLTVAVLIMAMAVASSFDVLAAQRVLVDRIVAIVGNEVITLSELMEASKMVPDEDPDLLLEKLIEDKLIEIEARRRAIEVTDAEVDAALETYVARLGVTMEEYKTVLADEGLTYDKYREEIRSSILKARFVKNYIQGDVEVTEEEMLNYYRRHPEQFRGKESVRLARIILPLPTTGDPADTKKVKTLADDIVRKVRAGENFSGLAKQYSKGSNAAEGGDLDWLDPAGLRPTYRNAIEDLGVGQVSDPFILEGAYHILYVKDRKESELIPMEDVKEDIFRTLYNKKIAEEFDRIVSKLKQEVPIEHKL